MSPPGAQPITLTVDIGGSALKASVLEPDGEPCCEPVRVATTYPCPPDALVRAVCDLTRPLPAYDRVSVGFPGMVRHGRVLSASNLATKAGPGTAPSPELVAAWSGFDLRAALERELERPTRVVNDADLQGAAVVTGAGLEVVITLGTGFGTAVFEDGRLAPHLELAHHTFRKGKTYDEQLGDAARKRIGRARWNKRVAAAVEALDAVFFFDHLYIGGGNSRRVDVDLGPKVTLVDNLAGILGGIRLWDPQASPPDIGATP
ncbi:MAG: ROK family protein [Microbacteriaceae bacterium]